MGIERQIKNDLLRSIIASTSLIFILLPTQFVMATESIDPEADKILRSMSSYLGKLTQFSYEADIDTEIINTQGQKLQFSSAVSALLNRPNNFHIHRRGPYAEAEFIFNGKTMTIYNKEHNAYFQAKAEMDIDNALRTIQIKTGLDMPGADMLYTDPYPGLVNAMTHSTYLGTAYVNGIKCHHLALRAATVDSQIWIQTGKTPIPLKHIVTSKWITGAPQHAIRYRNWNTKATVDTKKFNFVAVKGAKKLKAIQLNALGELILEEK